MTEKIDFNNEDLIAYLFLHTNLEQVIFSKDLLCKVSAKQKSKYRTK